MPGLVKRNDELAFRAGVLGPRQDEEKGQGNGERGGDGSGEHGRAVGRGSKRLRRLLVVGLKPLKWDNATR